MKFLQNLLNGAKVGIGSLVFLGIIAGCNSNVPRGYKKVDKPAEAMKIKRVEIVGNPYYMKVEGTRATLYLMTDKPGEFAINMDTFCDIRKPRYLFDPGKFEALYPENRRLVDKFWDDPDRIRVWGEYTGKKRRVEDRIVPHFIEVFGDTHKVFYPEK